MSVDDLVEAYLAGQEPTVPSELREEFERAIAGHQALAQAIGETVVAPERVAEDRGAPALPEDYEVVRELGRGGMGVVYLARQRSLGRLVAVKVLRPGEIAFGPFVKRFVEEARHLARLRHPNIVSIHETGQAGDEPYFTMDYVEGESLHSLLKRGPLSPTQAVRILKQAAEGVEHAHAQGIIHRDLKPANILLDKAGRAYVTDFGLARDVTKSSELTDSGDILGTPAYMSPEQARGRTDQVGEATDVHALGVIFYEMLTGKPPYGHDAPADVLVRLLQEEAVAPRKLNRRIPRDLETICLKAMAKDPEARYASVHVLLEDLQRFEKGDPIRARRSGPAVRLVRWSARHWKQLVLESAGAALLVGVLLFAFHRYGPRLFDKSGQQTLSIAESDERQGDHAAAVRTYYHAYVSSSDPKEKEKCLDRMVACCKRLGDGEDAVGAWSHVLLIAPDRSFGVLDGTVVTVLLKDLTRRHVYLSKAAKDDPKAAALALARLNVYLAGSTLEEGDREKAAQDHDVLEGVLHPDSPALLAKGAKDSKKMEELGTLWGLQSVVPLLAGTQEEREKAAELLNPDAYEALARIADDEEQAVWYRGWSAFALARKLEESGDPDGALARYRAAWSFLQSGFPFYSVSEDPAAGKPEEVNHNLLMIRDVDASIRRLDPATPERLRGGVVLHFEPRGLPPGWSSRFSVRLLSSTNPYPLTDEKKGVKDAHGNETSWSTFPGVGARLGMDGTACFGIADGRYRLTITEDTLGDRAPVDSTFHALVFDDLPQEVEVKGSWVDLPAVRTRPLTEVHLTAPAQEARIDLRHDPFRWSPVEGATKYKLTLGLSFEEKTEAWTFSQGVEYWSLNTTLPLLCIGELGPEELLGDRKKLQTSRAGEWSVKAYDGSDRLIGIASPSRRVFIEHGLDPEPVKPHNDLDDFERLESSIRDLAGTDEAARQKAMKDCAQNLDLLTRILDNKWIHRWKRGEAEFAIGRQLEQRGDRSGALARYRRAWDCMRSRHPFYSFPDDPSARQSQVENPDWCLTREVDASLRRLDPTTPEHLRGGITLRFEGSGVPSGWVPYVLIYLWAAPDSPEGDNQQPQSPFQWYVPAENVRLGAGGLVHVGVADGRYRMDISEGYAWRREEYAANLKFLHLLLFDGMPQEVEVKGGWVDLPPVRVRALKEITLASPSDKAHVDLRHEVFRWSTVEGAAKYKLDLYASFEGNIDGRPYTSSYNAYAEAVSPSLCVGELEAGKLGGQREAVMTGKSVYWAVEAYDGSDRLIGKSTARPCIVLDQGLEGKK